MDGQDMAALWMALQGDCVCLWWGEVESLGHGGGHYQHQGHPVCIPAYFQEWQNPMSVSSLKTCIPCQSPMVPGCRFWDSCFFLCVFCTSPCLSVFMLYVYLIQMTSVIIYHLSAWTWRVIHLTLMG